MLNRISISTKLAAAFGLALLVIVSAGIFITMQMATVNDITKKFRSVSLPKMHALKDETHLLSEHFMLAKRRIQTRDFRKVAKINSRLGALEEELSSKVADYQKLPLNRAEQNLLQDFKSSWETYLQSFRKVVDLYVTGQSKHATKTLNGPTMKALDASTAIIGDLAKLAEQETVKAEINYDRIYQQTRDFVIVGSLLSLLLFVFIHLWISVHISKPLKKLTTVMRRLTAGDDQAEVPEFVGRSDEIGILSAAADAYRYSARKGRMMSLIAERERKRLQSVITNMPLGLCMFDNAFKIIVCNHHFSEFYTLDGVNPQTITFNEILANQSAPRTQEGNEPQLIENIRQIITRQSSANPLFSEPLAALSETWQLPDGRYIKVDARQTSEGWLSIHQDITQSLKSKEQILHLAHHDALTTLPNRNLFTERIEEAIRQAKRGRHASILFIDLDHFKYVNDSLGHDAGDELLQEVARRLADAIGRQDIVSRLGGDEFAVIHASGQNRKSARTLALRIIESLNAPYYLHDQRIFIGASIGIALLPEHGTSTQVIMKNADIALYQAKNMGRGQCVFYSSKLDEDQRAKHHLVQKMVRAFENGEFVMHYQPIIDADTGKICAFEALMRWIDSDGKSISPGIFIPLAEEHGLIRKLGNWSIGETIRTAATWPSNLRLALNLSPAQLTCSDLVKTIADLLEQHKLDPKRFELEITETVLFEGAQSHLTCLNMLHAKGIRIALDDFGTGYSSLSHLRLFPFDKIKVDASFIQTASDDANSLAIIRAAVGLSKSLGIDCTAEGVETHQQLFLAQQEGFSELQGFVFGKAIPTQSIPAKIEQINEQTFPQHSSIAGQPKHSKMLKPFS